MKSPRLIIAGSFSLCLLLWALRAPEFMFSGFVIAAALAYWTRFAFLIGGAAAAVAMGAFGAFNSSAFVESASQAKNALPVLFGGVLLNMALFWAKETRFSNVALAGAGFVVGLCLTAAPLATPYLIGGAVFFYSLSSETRRAFWVPARRELKVKSSRILLIGVAVFLLVALMSFLLSRPYLGLTVESALAWVLRLILVLWLWNRGRLLIQMPKRVAAAVGGAVFGALVPVIVPKILGVPTYNETLEVAFVRWNDWLSFSPLLGQRFGQGFSYAYPLLAGLIAGLAAIAAVVLGLVTVPGKQKRVFLAAIVSIVAPLSVWLGIRAEMFLSTSYFFMILYPLYLAVALAAAYSRFRLIAAALGAPLILAAIVDLAAR